MEQATKPASKERLPLSPKRHKLADYERNLWVVTPEAGTSLDEVLKPEYWAHCADKMRAFDKVEVRAEDESYYAELLVRSAGKNWAVCSVLAQVDLDQKQVQVPEDAYTVGWGGPHQKHRVVRKSDNEVVFQGGETADAARAWLKEHLKAVGR